MTPLISVVLQARPLDRMPCDLALAGLFTTDRPLRSGAARLDWRLCGELSKQLMSEQITGESGDALLVSSGGALCAPRVLLLGLGDSDHYGPVVAQEAMADAMARCFALGVSRVAMTPLGVSSRDLPDHAASLIGGLLEASRDREDAFELTVAVATRHQDSAARALERAVKAVEPSKIRLQVAHRPNPKPEDSLRGSAAVLR